MCSPSVLETGARADLAAVEADADTGREGGAITESRGESGGGGALMVIIADPARHGEGRPIRQVRRIDRECHRDALIGLADIAAVDAAEIEQGVDLPIGRALRVLQRVDRDGIVERRDDRGVDAERTVGVDRRDGDRPICAAVLAAMSPIVTELPVPPSIT